MKFTFGPTERMPKSGMPCRVLYREGKAIATVIAYSETPMPRFGDEISADEYLRRTDAERVRVWNEILFNLNGGVS